MKYLLYYKLDSKFVADQTNAGGDGTKVVSVVDGVAWTNDAEKAYFRLSGEASAVTSYTVTVHYSFYDIALRKTISVKPDDIYNVDVYTGTSGNSLFVQPKNAEGYELDDEAYKMVEVTGNTEVTFNYKYKLDGTRLVLYHSSLNASYSDPWTILLIGNESALNGLTKIIVDNETEVLPGDLASGTSLLFPASPRTVHKFEYVYDHVLTDIPERAFSGCGVDKIIFPSSVTGIGDYAFYSTICQISDGTPGLVQGGTWTIPGHIKKIGNYAFRFMVSAFAASGLVLEDGIEYIGGGAFAEGSWVVMHWPNTLKYIGGNQAFRVSSGPDGHLTLPDSLETLDDGGTFMQSIFTGVTLGKNLSYIGDGTFTLCTKVREITFTSPKAPVTNSYAFSSIGADVTGDKFMYYPGGGTGYEWLINYFTEKGWICTPIYFKAYFETTGANQTVKLLHRASAVTEAYVDDTILVSGSDIDALTAYTFETPGIHTITVTNLSTVSATSFMHYVASIYTGNTDLVRIDYIAAGNSAPQQVLLSNCKKLSSVTLSDGTLGIEGFSGDTSLTSIVMPNSISALTQYGNGFKSCTSLTSVTLSKNLVEINSSGFCGCSSLSSITIPNSVTKFSSYAFYGCTSLTGISIPDGVEAISNYMFYNCSSLKYVNLGNGIKRIGDAVYETYSFGECKSLEQITIPDSCEIIGRRAFWACTSLKDINLGNGLKEIYSDCFYSATSLSSITLPNSLEIISGNGECFEHCINLSAFYGKFASSDHRMLISGCTVIAFAGAGLSSYTIPDSVCSLANYSFFEANLEELIVPNSIEKIEAYAFLQRLGTYIIKSTWLEHYCPVYGNIYYPNDTFAYRATSNSVSVSLKPGTKRISDYCFSGCNITNITLPNTLESLGNAAFYGCSALASLVIPNSVTNIGNSCFFGCKSLTAVTLPSGLTYLSPSLFYDCGNLTGITIPTSVTGIGDGCFSVCSGMTSLTIPSSVTEFGTITSIGGYVTNGVCCYCKSLTSITLPDSITSLTTFCFYGCQNLSDITLPSHLKRIESQCFRGCTSLTGLTFPASVEYVGSWIIEGCSSLTSLTSLATTAPELYDDGSSGGNKTFTGAPKNGILYYPAGSDYSVWMGQYQLGGKNWTTQEI